jgi:hypothetical protein
MLVKILYAILSKREYSIAEAALMAFGCAISMWFFIPFILLVGINAYYFPK